MRYLLTAAEARRQEQWDQAILIALPVWNALSDEEFSWDDLSPLKRSKAKKPRGPESTFEGIAAAMGVSLPPEMRPNYRADPLEDF